MKEFLLNLFFPKKCICCGKLDNYLCQVCFQKIILIKTPTCFKCGKITEKGQFCKSCRPKSSLTGIISAAYFKEGPLKEIIHSYKYEGLFDANKLLAAMLLRKIDSILPVQTKTITKYHHIKNLRSGKKDSRASRNTTEKTTVRESSKFIITYVPIHKTKLKSRGYNQSELLAKALAKEFNLEFLPLLIKIKETKSQMGLKRKEREINLKNCFDVLKKYQTIIKNRNIIIIDDIVTTGSTLNECGKVLRKYEPRQIWGMTVGKD